MKNKCELCGEQARMFCESDQANLCWDCDEKVHCANFLVAKHSRILLCHVCHSPTPWMASGRKLTPTVSVCDGCVQIHTGKCQDRDNHGDFLHDDGDGNDTEGFESYEESESEEEEEEEEEEDEDEDEDEDGENQVVPWSYDTSSSPPPPVTSSSEGEVSGGVDRVSKRMRGYGLDLDSDDEIECSSVQQGVRPLLNDEATSSFSHRPLKQARVVTGPNQSADIQDQDQDQDHDQDQNQDEDYRTELKSTAVIRSIQRLQNHIPTDVNDASKMIFGICKMSRDQNP